MCVGSPGTCACLLLYLPFGIPGLPLSRRDNAWHRMHALLQLSNIAASAQIISRCYIDLYSWYAVQPEATKQLAAPFTRCPVPCSATLAVTHCTCCHHLNGNPTIVDLPKGIANQLTLWDQSYHNWYYQHPNRLIPKYRLSAVLRTAVR